MYYYKYSQLASVHETHQSINFVFELTMRNKPANFISHFILVKLYVHTSFLRFLFFILKKLSLINFLLK